MSILIRETHAQTHVDQDLIDFMEDEQIKRTCISITKECHKNKTKRTWQELDGCFEQKLQSVDPKLKFIFLRAMVDNGYLDYETDARGMAVFFATERPSSIEQESMMDIAGDMRDSMTKINFETDIVIDFDQMGDDGSQPDPDHNLESGQDTCDENEQRYAEAMNFFLTSIPSSTWARKKDLNVSDIYRRYKTSAFYNFLLEKGIIEEKREKAIMVRKVLDSVTAFHGRMVRKWWNEQNRKSQFNRSVSVDPGSNYVKEDASLNLNSDAPSSPIMKTPGMINVGQIKITMALLGRSIVNSKIEDITMDYEALVGLLEPILKARG